MKNNYAFLDSVVAHLSQVADISRRRIFNGVSLYYGKVPFALVVNNRLYFHTDAHSRPLYQQHGMSAFQPRLATQVASRFYQVPDEVFRQPAELRHWLRIAVESASNQQTDDSSTRGDFKGDAEANFSNPAAVDIPLPLRQARA